VKVSPTVDIGDPIRKHSCLPPLHIHYLASQSLLSHKIKQAVAHVLIHPHFAIGNVGHVEQRVGVEETKSYVGRKWIERLAMIHSHTETLERAGRTVSSPQALHEQGNDQQRHSPTLEVRGNRESE
jgi:hypothetical protein